MTPLSNAYLNYLDRRGWEAVKQSPVQLLDEFLRYLDLSHEGLTACTTPTEFIKTLKLYVNAPEQFRGVAWRGRGIYSDR